MGSGLLRAMARERCVCCRRGGWLQFDPVVEVPVSASRSIGNCDSRVRSVERPKRTAWTKESGRERDEQLSTTNVK